MSYHLPTTERRLVIPDEKQTNKHFPYIQFLLLCCFFSLICNKSLTGLQSWIVGMFFKFALPNSSRLVRNLFVIWLLVCLYFIWLGSPAYIMQICCNSSQQMLHAIVLCCSLTPWITAWLNWLAALATENSQEKNRNSSRSSRSSLSLSLSLSLSSPHLLPSYLLNFSLII